MPSLPPFDSYFLAAYPLYPLAAAVVAWTALCGCIGFLIGRRPRPTRVIFLPKVERSNYEDAPSVSKVSELKEG